MFVDSWSVHCIYLDGNFKMNTHNHNSIEINYIEQGSVIYIVDGIKVELRKGDVLVLNAALPHLLIKDDPAAKLTSLAIDNLLLTSLGCNSFIKAYSTHRLLRDQKMAGEIIKEILKGCHASEYDNYMQSAIVYLIELLKKRQDGVCNYSEKAKNYISEHYTQICSIDSIAEMLNLSSIHLQRVFKRETGVTIGDYISRVRLSSAEYYLKHTTVPIGEIDTKIGLNSRQAFYALFKRYYGVSPEKFRKMALGFNK